MLLPAQLRDQLKYRFHACTRSNWADFIDMGLGIESRYNACQSWWQPHVNSTRALQVAALALCKKSFPQTTLLGAGRLFDAAPEIFDQSCSVAFYDADPLCIAHWRKKCYEEKVTGHYYHSDLTGAMKQWTEELSQSQNLLPYEVVTLLQGLRGHPPEIQGDVIISINLLSQIPLYWRERVSAILPAYSTESHDLLEALRESERVLEQEHLQMLATSNARVVVLISDREFLYYNRKGSIVERKNALVSENIDLDKINPKLVKRKHIQWCWHLVPIGVESNDYGIIHLVEGAVYS
jgi:hypothetical protein